MGKSRRKGHGYEREVARQFRVIFPRAERLLEYQFSQANGVDLQNTGRLAIQCKRHKSYVPVNTINEIKPEGTIKVLVTKGDRIPAMVILSLDDFIEILLDPGIIHRTGDNDHDGTQNQSNRK